MFGIQHVDLYIEAYICVPFCSYFQGRNGELTIAPQTAGPITVVGQQVNQLFVIPLWTK